MIINNLVAGYHCFQAYPSARVISKSLLQMPAHPIEGTCSSYHSQTELTLLTVRGREHIIWHDQFLNMASTLKPLGLCACTNVDSFKIASFTPFPSQDLGKHMVLFSCTFQSAACWDHLSWSIL